MSPLTRFLNPWRYRREQHAAQVALLRQRDGDACRRCRRPIRFDFPSGHDQAARIEAVVPVAADEPGQAQAANLCLTHVRCVASGQDHTAEVSERLRPKREADLFANARERRAA